MFTRFQIAIQAKTPLSSDSLWIGSANEHLRFVNVLSLDWCLNRDKAIVTLMSMPGSDPTTFTGLRQ